MPPLPAKMFRLWRDRCYTPVDATSTTMHMRPTPPTTLLTTVLLVQVAQAAPVYVEHPPGPSPEQPAGEYLSRTRLLELAVRGNLELHDAGIVLRIAETRVAGERGPFDWNLDGGSSLNQTLSPDPFSPTELRRRTTSEAYLRLRRTLRTGATLQLRLVESFTQFPLLQLRLPDQLNLTIPGDAIGQGVADITFPVRVDTGSRYPSYIDVFAAATEVSVTQPLLRGAGRASLDRARRLAEMGYQAARVKQKATASRVLALVVRLAAELSLARADHILRAASRDRAQQELEITRAKVAAGHLPEIAELQIRQTIAEREVTSLEAQQRIRDLDAELRQALGLDSALAPLNPAIPVATSSSSLPSTRWLVRAMGHNHDILLARNQVEEARAVTAAAANDRLPRLDLAAGIGLVAQDPDGLQVWQRLASTRDGFNWHVSAIFGMPLENNLARSRHREAQLAHERAQLALLMTEKRIGAEVHRALQRVDLTVIQRRTAATARDLAARSAEGEEERYHLGLVTAYDMLEAQERLRRAEFSLARVEHDLAMAELRLWELSGDLLKHLGVEQTD